MVECYHEFYELIRFDLLKVISEDHLVKFMMHLIPHSLDSFQNPMIQKYVIIII